MTDIYNTLKDYLLADAGVLALVASRGYIDVTLPPGYQVSDGDAFVLHPISGTSLFYANTSDAIRIDSYSSTTQGAIDLNEAIFDALKETNNPANATAFYALPVQRGRMMRLPGDMIAMFSAYEVSEVI